MTYRLDDEGAHDDAIVNAGNEAYGACVRAGQHCAHKMTGGAFSRAVAMMIANEKVWARAVKHGLVTEDVAAETFQLCEILFLRFNPSAAKAREIRCKRAKVGHLGGLASGQARTEGKPKQSASVVADQTETKDESENEPLGSWGSGVVSGSGSDPEGSPEGGENADPTAGESGTVRIETVRETACRAYGEGIRAVVDGPAFRILENESAVLVQVIGDTPKWVGLRGDQLAQVVRKSAADYAMANRESAKFERGFSPTKWVEWLRAGGSSRPRPGVQKGPSRAVQPPAAKLFTPAKEYR